MAAQKRGASILTRLQFAAITYVDDLSLASEARGSIRHEALTLGDANDGAQVGLSTLAELALAALRHVQRNDVVTDGNASHSLANALDDSRTFVAENDGEDRFRVLSREQVSVGVAQSSADDLHTDLASLRGSNLDFLHH